MIRNDRFNYMTQKEYEKRCKKEEPVIRSCWKCNSAHKYLKNADFIIYCVWCGVLYYKGKRLKVIENETN